MTRFARMQKRKHLEATPWKELVGESSGEREECHSNLTAKAKNKKRKKEITVKTSPAGGSPDLPAMSGEPEHGGNKKVKKQKQQSQSMNEEGHVERKKHRIQEKLEKRREARRKRREKKRVCFNCRKSGHKVSDCPQSVAQSGVGACYKCGSSEHTTRNCKEAGTADNPFPFAECFVCGNGGHLARECAENPRGLYPQGGGCKICGSVEHFKKDCPEKVQNKAKGSKDQHRYVASSLTQRGHTSADAELEQEQNGPSNNRTKTKRPKIVKF